MRKVVVNVHVDGRGCGYRSPVGVEASEDCKQGTPTQDHDQEWCKKKNYGVDDEDVVGGVDVSSMSLCCCDGCNDLSRFGVDVVDVELLLLLLEVNRGSRYRRIPSHVGSQQNTSNRLNHSHIYLHMFLE